VNLRVTGIGPISRPSLSAVTTAGPLERSGTRPVCFDGTFEETPTYWRPSLPAGSTVEGPAVIEEYGATVPLHPGFSATVDHLGNLIVRRSQP